MIIPLPTRSLMPLVAHQESSAHRELRMDY